MVIVWLLLVCSINDYTGLRSIYEEVFLFVANINAKAPSRKEKIENFGFNIYLNTAQKRGKRQIIRYFKIGLGFSWG